MGGYFGVLAKDHSVFLSQKAFQVTARISWSKPLKAITNEAKYRNMPSLRL
jgi:hypothetical protein